jgi:poly(3-hydroxybutyrate) depolymerase
LHRIKNQVGGGGRIFDIEFSNGGRMAGPLIVRGARAFGAKKVFESRLAILVTRYKQMSKNF